MSDLLGKTDCWKMSFSGIFSHIHTTDGCIEKALETKQSQQFYWLVKAWRGLQRLWSVFSSPFHISAPLPFGFLASYRQSVHSYPAGKQFILFFPSFSGFSFTRLCPFGPTLCILHHHTSQLHLLFHHIHTSPIWSPLQPPACRHVKGQSGPGHDTG